MRESRKYSTSRNIYLERGSLAFNGGLQNGSQVHKEKTYISDSTIFSITRYCQRVELNVLVALEV